MGFFSSSVTIRLRLPNGRYEERRFANEEAANDWVRNNNLRHLSKPRTYERRRPPPTAQGPVQVPGQTPVPVPVAQPTQPPVNQTFNINTNLAAPGLNHRASSISQASTLHDQVPAAPVAAAPVAQAPTAQAPVAAPVSQTPPLHIMSLARAKATLEERGLIVSLPLPMPGLPLEPLIILDAQRLSLLTKEDQAVAVIRSYGGLVYPALPVTAPAPAPTTVPVPVPVPAPAPAPAPVFACSRCSRTYNTASFRDSHMANSRFCAEHRVCFSRNQWNNHIDNYDHTKCPHHMCRHTAAFPTTGEFRAHWRTEGWLHAQ